MRSKPVATGEQALASQYDSVREDARGAGFLLPHQQLGAFAMPTNPTNGQTITWTINGSAVVETFVSVLGTTPGSVLIGLNITATLVNHLAFLRNPSATNTTQVAAGANAQLIQYVGWAFPTAGTTIMPFSLNNVQNTPLSSFTATTTVTGASWTAQTLELYIEAGTYYVGTTRVIYPGGSTPTFTAPVSHPRIDIVTADSSGTIAITQGTENVSPTAPSYPTNKLVICEVYNVVGETALYDFDNQQTSEGYIYNDVRPFLEPAYISSLSQVASGLFIPDPGGEAQGDILYYGASGWVLLSPGIAGQFLQTNGASANPQWTVASPQVAQTTTPVTVTSGVTTEQTQFSFTLPANTLGTAGVLKVRLWFSEIPVNTSGTTTGTVRAYFSTTVVATLTIPPYTTASNGNGYVDFTLFSGGSTGSQAGVLQIQIFDIAGTVLNNSSSAMATGTASVDSTMAQTVKITTQQSGNVGNSQVMAMAYAFA